MKEELAIGVVSMLLGLVIGGFIAGNLAREGLQRAAINHNAAHYDPRTGAFTWNEPESKP